MCQTQNIINVCICADQTHHGVTCPFFTDIFKDLQGSSKKTWQRQDAYNKAQNILRRVLDHEQEFNCLGDDYICALCEIDRKIKIYLQWRAAQERKKTKKDSKSK